MIKKQGTYLYIMGAARFIVVRYVDRFGDYRWRYEVTEPEPFRRDISGYGSKKLAKKEAIDFLREKGVTEYARSPKRKY